MKIYTAGKISKESSFGGHHWRENFIAELSKLSALHLENLDPLADETQDMQPGDVFIKDCKLIQECDVFIVYLSDDISVGGSQEILIARYFKNQCLDLLRKGASLMVAHGKCLAKS